MSDFSFSKKGVERPVDGFTPLPVGEYSVIIEKTEWVIPFGGEGETELKLTLNVIEGPFQNRKVWKKLRIKDDDPVELKKAKAVLAQLLDAIGLDGIENTAELQNIPLKVKTSIFTPPGKEPMTVVNAFIPMVGAMPAIGQPVAPAKKPWE
jgi:hypothetical protein